MATEINTSLQTNSPFSLDYKYLYQGYRAYANKAEVIATIILAYRSPLLTVVIGTREWWFKGGLEEVNLVPKSNMDVIVLNGADGTYTHKAEETILGFIVSTTVLLPAFKIGITDGGEEITESYAVPITTGIPFPSMIYTGANATIYFSGIAAVPTAVVVIKILIY